MQFVLSLVTKSGEERPLGVDEQFARLLGIPDESDELSQVSRLAKIDLRPLRGAAEGRSGLRYRSIARMLKSARLLGGVDSKIRSAVTAYYADPGYLETADFDDSVRRLADVLGALSQEGEKEVALLGDLQ
jgi:hypothetical protein